MNWDALQAAAEWIAALGVLASLGYVGSHIRQNTQAVRSATAPNSTVRRTWRMRGEGGR